MFGLLHTPSWRGFRHMDSLTAVSKPISSSRLLAYNLTVVQLATKFIALNGSQSSLSCSHHWAVPWVILALSTLLHPVSWRLTLTVSSSVCPGCLPDVLLLLLLVVVVVVVSPYLSSCVFFFICCFLIVSVLVPILWQITRLLSQHRLLLLLLLLLSSSSLSPLCRVFILIFPRQTMSLGNTVLHLLYCCCSWYLYRQFQCWIYCTFTLVLSEVCVQCPIWLFSGVPWLHAFWYFAHVFSEWLWKSSSCPIIIIIIIILLLLLRIIFLLGWQC